MSVTIFALASGPPPAAIAVVRLSGAGAFAALAQLIRRALPAERRLSLATLFDPGDGTVLDHAMVVRFTGPRSPTGEDVVELHLHGGSAVISAVLRVLATLPGLRLARAGEFTRRAFDAGRLGVGDVTALAALVEAQTEVQRFQALNATTTPLLAVVERWHAALLDLRAEVEADLDFAETEADVTPSVMAGLRPLAEAVAAQYADLQRGEAVRHGVTVAVVGAPNVGKSSLINALVQRAAMIVSPVAGTTRDLVEFQLDLDGVLVRIADTAGEHQSADAIEREGMRRAADYAAAADIVLHVVDDPEVPRRPAAQRVLNKIDRWTSAVPTGTDVLHVSATTGAGLPALRDWLAGAVTARVRPGEPVQSWTAHHAAALRALAAELASAAAAPDAVMVAEHLRRALAALDTLRETVPDDAVLDRIFARFCIGK